MSRDEALEVMGLTADVSFDRIMSTKNKLQQRQTNQGKLDKVGVDQTLQLEILALQNFLLASRVS